MDKKNSTPTYTRDEFQQDMSGPIGHASIEELRYIADRPGETVDLGIIKFTGLGGGQFSTSDGRVYTLKGAE